MKIIYPSILIVRFFTLFAFFLLFSCEEDRKSVQSYKETESDSLQYFLDEANNDLVEISLRKNFNERAQQIILQSPNDSMFRVNMFKIANRYFNMNDLENYKLSSEQIVQYATKAKDSISLAKAYSYLGDYYGKKFQSELAFQNYFNAERIYRKKKINASTAKTLLNKSVIQYNEKDYVGAERSSLDALKLLKTFDNIELSYETYNILGIIYFKLEEFEKSLEFHNKALKIAETGNLPTSNETLATTLNNIGVIFQTKKEFQKSILYFEKALQTSDFRDKLSAYATLKDNIGFSNLKLNNNKDLPQLFYEALKIRDSLQIITGVTSSQINLSIYYANTKDTLQSIKFAKKAYDISKDHNIPSEVLLSLKQLIKVDNNSSAEYSEEYIRINDSLQLAERKIRNKLARIEFETDELVMQKEQLVEQRKNLIYIGLSIIIIGVFAYILRYQITKNRELRLIQQQQIANEEIYQLMINQQDKIEEVRNLEKKKISQDLHDGILGKLFGSRINLEILNHELTESASISRKKFIDELQNIEQEIREISHDLSSEKKAIMNNFGLMLIEFLENQKSNHPNLSIQYTISPIIDWSLFNNITKINLYRILQEAFQNIHKYSKAKSVVITFNIQENSLFLQIKDDGIGFDIIKKKKGIGLNNMANRMKDTQGNMNLISNIGMGTTIEFKIPKNNIPN